jgi:hypothetical protein
VASVPRYSTTELSREFNTEAEFISVARFFKFFLSIKLVRVRFTYYSLSFFTSDLVELAVTVLATLVSRGLI